MKWRQATFQKKIQNNNSEDEPVSWENNGEDARNVYQRPARTKEQTGVNNILEGISRRIIEAEEQINSPEDRMLEITATEQNIEKE